MPRTVIAASSIITPLGPYPTLPVSALALDLAWQASDISNQNYFPLGTGKYLILVRNVHATTGYTFTLTSSADERKRTGHISTYALAAGKVAAFMVDQQAGWIQTDGGFYLEGNNASVEFCIIRLP